MVRHIVLWRLKSESDADFQAIRAALEGQAGRIPGLRRVEVGRCFNRAVAPSTSRLYATSKAVKPWRPITGTRRTSRRGLSSIR